MAHSVDSQDSACSHTHGRALSQQSKISKGEQVYGAKSERNQAQASEGPLSVEPHRMHLIPPAPVVTGPGNAAHQGRSPEPGSSGYLSEGQSRRHRQPSTCQNSKLPKGRAGVQHKPHCSYKQFRHREPLQSVLSGGNSLEIEVCRHPVRGQSCPFKGQQPDLLCELFPIRRHNTLLDLEF